jgi:hypothetical protein
MTTLRYLAMVAIACAAALVLVRAPSHARQDFWTEPRGSAYITCHREGSFDPVAQFALFGAPNMIRQRLRIPLPACSGAGVRFPRAQTAEQKATVRAEEEKDAAGVILAFIVAVMTVRVAVALERRLRCRKQQCSGLPVR